MFSQRVDLDGPDFLDAFADAELAGGNEINAAAFRERSQQWQRDRNRIDELESQLAAASQPLRSLPRHAVTPTDRRSQGPYA